MDEWIGPPAAPQDDDLGRSPWATPADWMISRRGLRREPHRRRAQPPLLDFPHRDDSVRQFTYRISFANLLIHGHIMNRIHLGRFGNDVTLVFARFDRVPDPFGLVCVQCGRACSRFFGSYLAVTASSERGLMRMTGAAALGPAPNFRSDQGLR